MLEHLKAELDLLAARIDKLASNRLKQALMQDIQAVYVVLEKNEYQANLLRTRLMLEVTKAENNQALKAMIDNDVDLKAASWYNKQ
jgi:hypothetical protein